MLMLNYLDQCLGPALFHQHEKYDDNQKTKRKSNNVEKIKTPKSTLVVIHAIIL